MARPHPNVLIVDDDAATRDGLSALLESWGYHASAVANGQAALQRCNQDLPHAIVSDLMMPGMTGLQFIWTVKAAENFTTEIEAREEPVDPWVLHTP